MQSRQLSANEYLLVFTEPDVEVIAALNDFAAEYDLPSGRLQAIGSVSSATLAWWSYLTKKVEKTTVSGQFELVSFLGNITSKGDGPRIHAHAVLTGPAGLVGGHAVALTPCASVEVSITVTDTPVSRVKNPKFELPIIDVEG
jgi:predicted DNA-binding protein with PD1-like motif